MLSFQGTREPAGKEEDAPWRMPIRGMSGYGLFSNPLPAECFYCANTGIVGYDRAMKRLKSAAPTCTAQLIAAAL